MLHNPWLVEAVAAELWIWGTRLQSANHKVILDFGPNPQWVSAPDSHII